MLHNLLTQYLCLLHFKSPIQKMTNKQIFESKLQSSIHYCTKKMVGKGKMWQRLFVWNVDKNFLAVNSSDVIFFSVCFTLSSRPSTALTRFPWKFFTPNYHYSTQFTKWQNIFWHCIWIILLIRFEKLQIKRIKKQNNLEGVPSSFLPSPLGLRIWNG